MADNAREPQLQPRRPVIMPHKIQHAGNVTAVFSKGATI